MPTILPPEPDDDYGGAPTPDSLDRLDVTSTEAQEPRDDTPRYATIRGKPILDQRVELLKDGRMRRESVVRTKGKYPLLLVRDTLGGDDPLNSPITSQEVMVADHIIVTLNPGKARADLETFNASQGAAIRRTVSS